MFQFAKKVWKTNFAKKNKSHSSDDDEVYKNVRHIAIRWILQEKTESFEKPK